MARVEKVRIKPAADKRKQFSRWAVQNGVRTITQIEFHVPSRLLPSLPEELLIGASIDSQLYIPASRFVISDEGAVKKSKAPEVKSEPAPEIPVAAPVAAPEAPVNTGKLIIPSEVEFAAGESPQELETAIVEAIEQPIPPAPAPEPAEQNEFACNICYPARVFNDDRGLAIHMAHKHKSE